VLTLAEGNATLGKAWQVRVDQETYLDSAEMILLINSLPALYGLIPSA
jgi:hypothetical protein